MIFGYCRVSSTEQRLDRQLVVLEPLCDKVLTEKVSGKSTSDRPVLQNLLSQLRAGDTLLALSIDRLARNTKDLLELVDELIEQGVTVKFVDNNMSFDNSPASRLILTMMGAVAEFERGIIASRRNEGISLARQAGRYKGKQKNQELHNKIIDMLQAGKNTPDEIAKLCDCGRATVFRVKKEMLASTGGIKN
ncbi:TPA: recombinase family protein [Yersinia enterocolitica]|uniref:recombinase family protein n=1 Tax=Yersinia TaxID=629 RepID=UPI0005DFC91F|nr:recombinase family protein [Yersinia frederiksenii]EKN4054913.1 recombinase family protein [Yersinia enterocolitica]EKN5918590.1 recombinase family protein [Yersinia enterocolitica]CNK97421.1 putative resolvase [Yersinia frederiksenii]HDL6738090.1 recombinase family protein [Yersinia enterocolitica]HDW8052344.1 recombinase family protein [Yersinia enterocolitica]